MAAYLKYPRGTRANFNTLRSASGLIANTIYWITDENRFEYALTVNTSTPLPKAPDDTAYNAGTWDGDVVAPTKNAVRDKIETMQNLAFMFHLNGGGSALAAAQYIDLPNVPFACTVTGWRIVGDVSGSAVVDIRRATYANYPTISTSIAGTEKPTLSSAQKNEDTSLTTWTTSLAQGDVLRAYVESASTVGWVSVELLVTRT